MTKEREVFAREDIGVYTVRWNDHTEEEKTYWRDFALRAMTRERTRSIIHWCAENKWINDPLADGTDFDFHVFDFWILNYRIGLAICGKFK